MATGHLRNGGPISRSSVPIMTRRLHRSEIMSLQPVSVRLRQKSPEAVQRDAPEMVCQLSDCHLTPRVALRTLANRFPTPCAYRLSDSLLCCHYLRTIGEPTRILSPVFRP